MGVVLFVSKDSKKSFVVCNIILGGQLHSLRAISARRRPQHISFSFPIYVDHGLDHAIDGGSQVVVAPAYM